MSVKPQTLELKIGSVPCGNIQAIWMYKASWSTAVVYTIPYCVQLIFRQI